MEIDRSPVNNADDAAKLLGKNRASGHLARVQRGEASVFLVIPEAHGEG